MPFPRYRESEADHAIVLIGRAASRWKGVRGLPRHPVLTILMTPCNAKKTSMLLSFLISEYFRICLILGSGNRVPRKTQGRETHNRW
jgi:hypothetical protein